jgi:hypothetical protein
MTWWDTVINTLKEGDKLFTPGRGPDGGNKKRPFWIEKKLSIKIYIKSGKIETPLIPIEKECFDFIEQAFNQNKFLQLRVASKHDNEPFENSADQLCRIKTGSNLARGNYVCSILEYCKLVKYSMYGNKKTIVLPY